MEPHESFSEKEREVDGSDEITNSDELEQKSLFKDAGQVASVMFSFFYQIWQEIETIRKKIIN